MKNIDQQELYRAALPSVDKDPLGNLIHDDAANGQTDWTRAIAQDQCRRWVEIRYWALCEILALHKPGGRAGAGDSFPGRPMPDL